MVIVTKAALEPCLNVPLGILKAPENEGFSTIPTADMDFNALVYHDHLVMHPFSHECFGLHIAKYPLTMSKF